MFQKISRTNYPPSGKPVMVWDGDCPFCRYWIEYLQRFTDHRVEYAPYQKVNAYFKDMPVDAFQEAVQFIEINGKVYSGLNSAYRSFYYFEKPTYFLHRMYQKSTVFAAMSDHLYDFISKRRPLMYRLTVCFFGGNPKRLKPYGMIWIAGIFLFLFALTTKTKFRSEKKISLRHEEIQP